MSELLAAGAEPGRLLAVRRPLVRQPGRPAGRPRGPGRRSGRGLPAGRRRLGRGSRRPPGRGWTCAPGRAARPRCWPGWPIRGERCWPSTSPRTGPRWSAGRSGPTRGHRRCWSPTAPGRRGGRASFARVLVDVPVHRAGGAATPTGVPLAAATRRGRAAARPAARPAGLGASTARARAGWSATSPAPRTGARPSMWSPRRWPGATTSRWFRPPACCRRRSRTPTTGDFVQLWPHRHGTDAMFAAYLRRRD